MSCYHPLLGVPEYRSESGSWCFVPRGDFDPDIAFTWIWTSDENKRGDRPLPIKIPCGKCVGCRLDYSRQWADRMMLELDHSKKGIFLTLTYDNDHVPFTENEYGEFGALSLDKSDLQKFFKRLRKRFSNKEIRFYASGEYGSHTQRPHYHAIVFGLSLEDFPDRVPKGNNELGQAYFVSQKLQDIWSQGFCLLADVSWKTCAYVARYVMKKAFPAKSYFQDMNNCEPEFSLMSRRPGLGGFYFEDHPEKYDLSKLYVSGCDHGISIPRYHIKKLELIDKELYDKIISDRKEFAKDGVLKKVLNTDLSYLEQLEVEENKKLLQLSALRRL